jgi:hypothetical protein
VPFNVPERFLQAIQAQYDTKLLDLPALAIKAYQPLDGRVLPELESRANAEFAQKEAARKSFEVNSERNLFVLVD